MCYFDVECQVPAVKVLNNGVRFISNVFTVGVVIDCMNIVVYWKTTMSGLRLIEPTELYNLINQETRYPCLSDPVFMLLIGELL